MAVVYILQLGVVAVAMKRRLWRQRQCHNGTAVFGGFAVAVAVSGLLGLRLLLLLWHVKVKVAAGGGLEAGSCSSSSCRSHHAPLPSGFLSLVTSQRRTEMLVVGRAS